MLFPCSLISIGIFEGKISSQYIKHILDSLANILLYFKSKHFSTNTRRFNMNKRILTLVISLVVLLSFAACGTTAPPPPPADTTPADTTPAPTGPALVEAIEDPTRNIHFAVLFGVGGRGDNAFNDEVYEGVAMAVEMFGATYNYAEPSDIGEFEIQLRAFAESGEYDVIIAVSNQMVDALLMVAEDFPEQRFSMIDVAVYDVPNIWSLTVSYSE